MWPYMTHTPTHVNSYSTGKSMYRTITYVHQHYGHRTPKSNYFANLDTLLKPVLRIEYKSTQDKSRILKIKINIVN